MKRLLVVTSVAVAALSLAAVAGPSGKSGQSSFTGKVFAVGDASSKGTANVGGNSQTTNTNDSNTLNGAAAGIVAGHNSNVGGFGSVVAAGGSSHSQNVLDTTGKGRVDSQAAASNASGVFLTLGGK